MDGAKRLPLMARRYPGVILVVLIAGITPAVLAAPATNGERVTIIGAGAAHGLGMAMDGVEGQARAGWSHDKILDTFYPGTASSTFSGTIRVGLGEGGTQSISLPTGGVVSTAIGGPGLTVEPGKTLSMRDVGGGVSHGGPVTTPPPTPAPKKKTAPPTQPPTDILTVVGVASPTPAPTVAIPQRAQGASEPVPVEQLPRSLFVRGSGDPALVTVGQTGHRYRGTIEVRRVGAGRLLVVNHVGLEDYVAGIAEEKGQGWPLEGLKTLAVAARTLGAATMTWYDKSKPFGYDICPSANCQVYLGYDGEEASLRRAVTETAGKIRTHGGRPIMAMYHGNGGGQTETYESLGGSTAHPYLRSVRYEYADPSTWRVDTSLDAIAAALAAKGVGVPGALEGIEITKRGTSPRVVRLKLIGDGASNEISGTTFATALELRSTWFEFADPARATVELENFAGDVEAIASAPATPKDGSHVLLWTLAIFLVFAGAHLAGWNIVVPYYTRAARAIYNFRSR